MAARLLERLCADYTDQERVAAQIHALERDGDELSHASYEQLNAVFMPPLDREDIITLTSALDDVIDLIDAAADSMYVYNISQPTATARELATVIVACVEPCGQDLTVP